MILSKKWSSEVRGVSAVPFMVILILIALGFLLAVVVLILLFAFTPDDRQVLLSSPKKLTHDGLERTYRIYVPKNGGKKSLIIGLHALGGSGRRFAFFTGLHNATDENTIVVYPDAVPSNKKGLKAGWNSTYCCGTGLESSIDDAGFILALIERLIQDYDIDQSKIFITGFSNGATMSQYLATEYPKKFAGVAAISGSVGVKKKVLKPSSAVPILLAHGKRDTDIPFKGGITGDDEFFNWLDFSTTVDTWKNVNGCGQETKIIEQSNTREIIDYEGCDALVRSVIYTNLGHQWDDWRIGKLWRKTPRGSKLVVSFFEDIPNN